MAGFGRSIEPVARFVRTESGHSGQIRNPLSPTTIQEKGLLGNRISLRRTELLSGRDDRAESLKLAVIIFAEVLCSALAG